MIGHSIFHPPNSHDDYETVGSPLTDPDTTGDAIGQVPAPEPPTTTTKKSRGSGQRSKTSKSTNKVLAGPSEPPRKRIKRK